MLTAHHVLAFVVLVVTSGGGPWALWAYRRGSAGVSLLHVLSLSQTVLMPQVRLGLLLLSQHYRAPRTRRAFVAFYGAALVLVAAFGVYFWRGAGGPDAAAFLVIIALCVFSMIRVWRDQRRY